MKLARLNAKKMAKGQSSDVNFATSLSDKENQIADDKTPESIAEQKSSNVRLLRLIKAADIDGIFRLVNNIDEHLSDRELARMDRHMNKKLALKLA